MIDFAKQTKKENLLDLENINQPDNSCLSEADAKKSSQLLSESVCYSEQKFYFSNDKTSKVVSKKFDNTNITNVEIYTIDLGQKNPLYFKIGVVYDNEDEIYTQIYVGGADRFGKKLSAFLKDKSLKDLIQNGKITESNARSYANQKLMDWHSRFVTCIQSFGLSFYWEDNKYYLQIVVQQDVSLSSPGNLFGKVSMGIGQGFKLIM